MNSNDLMVRVRCCDQPLVDVAGQEFFFGIHFVFFIVRKSSRQISKCTSHLNSNDLMVRIRCCDQPLVDVVLQEFFGIQLVLFYDCSWEILFSKGTRLFSKGTTSVELQWLGEIFLFMCLEQEFFIGIQLFLACSLGIPSAFEVHFSLELQWLHGKYHME